MSEQRDRILACACDLYLEDGLEGFSMRRLARSVGVTAPALYRHYESKEALLLDVVGEAYRRLAEYLYAALRGRTPEERFQLAGEGYLSFALENVRLYEVLFAYPDLIGMAEVSGEVEEQACALGQFWNDRVRECMDSGILRPMEPERVGQTLWAHAHGIISLYLQGMIPLDEAAFREMYLASSRRLLLGLATEEYGKRIGEAAEGAGAGSAV